MNRIVEVFKKPRVLLPVVHCRGREQVERNVEVAFANGADGVFLINQGGMSSSWVLREARWIRDIAPGRIVGVNLLGLACDEALPHVMGGPLGGGYLPMLWSDDAGIRAAELDSKATTFANLRRYYGPSTVWIGLFFGGVAFKYLQPVSPELYGQTAANAVRNGVDVVTTSGPATGSPPTVDKIRAMKEAIGDHALAIASGITPENVETFLPYADAYLVATGIEQSFGEFDTAKLRALADTIHGWKG
jgi:hypothetical protein